MVGIVSLDMVGQRTLTSLEMVGQRTLSYGGPTSPFVWWANDPFIWWVSVSLEMVGQHA